MSSVFVGSPDSVVEVLVLDVPAEYVPCSDKHLARNGDLYFHPVLSADLCLMIGEAVEETALGAARAPGALDEGAAQVAVAMGDAA